jgi:hypothetical protein
MTTSPEARDFTTTLHLRDVQSVGRPYKYIEGRAVPYETWADLGLFLEQHARGSFKRTTNNRSGKGLPLMLFHDAGRFPIGHAERWENDDDGLRGVWQLNDSADAQTAARMAEQGDLVGLSVGFQDVQEPRIDWPDNFDAFDIGLGPDSKPRVTRIESRLVEVSMTPTPAYRDAAVTMIRTRGLPAREQREREVDHWRRVLDGIRSAS